MSVARAVSWKVLMSAWRKGEEEEEEKNELRRLRESRNEKMKRLLQQKENGRMNRRLTYYERRKR